MPALVGRSQRVAAEPLPGAPQPVQYPLLGGYLIGNPHNYDQTSYQAQIAKLDLAILGMYNGWGNMAAAVNAIKVINPEILLGNYTLMTEVYKDSSNAATAERWTKLSSSVGPNGIGDWWAYDNTGAHTDWAAGAFQGWDTNLTLNVTPDANGDRYPQYAAKLDYRQVIQNVGLDIWYCDNNFWKPRSDADWNRDGTNDSKDTISVRNQWRDGQRAYYDVAKTLAPGMSLMVNADSDLNGTGPYPGGTDVFTQYQSVAHGGLMERIMGETWSAETWGGWSTAMGWYRTLKTNLIGRKLIVFDVTSPGTDYQYLRYAFGSCLMDDGYFFANVDNNQIPWYDEYDLAGTASTKWLGTAVDAPPTSAWQLGVYRRNFSGGCVLVNPKGNGSRTVTIEAGYTRFTGTQAPSVNNGAAASSITLADRDAIFLVKTGGGGGGGGGPAFDAVGPDATGTTSAGSTTLSWSHTCSGSNRLLIVTVAMGLVGDGGTTLSATYNGVAMTSVGVVHANNGTDGYVQMFRLIAPVTGTNTVQITAAGNTPHDLVGGSVSFNNVNQTSPLGTPATAFGSGTTPTVNVAGTTSGNLVVDAVCNGSSITSSGQTNRWLRNANTSTAAGNAASSTALGGGTVTMAYTVSSDWWGILAVEVKA